MKWWVVLGGLVTFFGGRPASAAGTVVAVMPFRDLSGGKSSVGEAIRETVTTDLKDVPELTLVERGAIDKILTEQHLQSSRAELDPLSTVRVGKLLGAGLIVTGAYQRADNSLRLTARFVRVETGEVIGTAKCDGAAGDFFALQDRVTVELLRSAGMQKHVEHFARRARPRMKSLHTMELYGDAVAEPDEEKREQLLKLALNEDPTFEYAARDLDALEKRLARLGRVAQVAEGQKLAELRRQIGKESDPGKRNMMQMQLFGLLVSGRRWLTVRREARVLLAGPVEAAVPPSTIGTTEVAGFYLVQADQVLRDADATLHDGEQFLSRFPTSMYFSAVKGMVESTIAKKRRADEGGKQLDDDLAKVSGEQRWNLCQFAWVYRSHDQHKAARRFLRACLQVGTAKPKIVLSQLVQEDLECGDFAQAKKDLSELVRVDPADAHNYESQIPADD